MATVRLTAEVLRRSLPKRALTQVLAISLGLCSLSSVSADPHSETANGAEWAGYGRTSDENHYSPLAGITSKNISRLGLAWSFDIPGVVLATSVPLEVEGTLYFATGYSVVRAVDATTGHLRWTYDPEVYKVAGPKLRFHWGIRGIAFWNDRIYIGTHDGRLISLDAKTGKPHWIVGTTQSDDLRIITGPPLVFDGKVIIGHGGTELGPVRGYVTAYDADTGKQLWRFFTVPGDPKRGFENKAMETAAKTWHGEWWKYGGGGVVWNAMTYDSELKRVYIGISNGAPWNRKIRSPGGGDNLFLASIVALNPETGEYVWHYQSTPGDTWDFDASEDMELATVVIDNVRRRVLLQASKNGFFYVIDRDTGRLISAEKFAKVTWAEKIDLQTGRPIEVPNARYQSGSATVWPGSTGAHGPQPMAFNPAQNLAFIPVLDLPGYYDDRDVDLKTGKHGPDFVPRLGLNVHFEAHASGISAVPTNLASSSLVAWDPVGQRAAWRVALPGIWNGGVATTAGNLVFQGRSDGQFIAYAADTGKALWSFDAQTGIVGAPITYEVAGRQFVSVMAGFGGSGSAAGSQWDARTQPRRLLTFALDSDAHLPPAPPHHDAIPVQDSGFKSNPSAEQKGAMSFGLPCGNCHGMSAVAGGAAPDLRASPAILSADAFRGIVKEGALLPRGMPRFDNLSDAELEHIRQYLRSRAKDLASTNRATNAGAH
jgi:quinohemoprotein ethanol dehydrogenase